MLLPIVYHRFSLIFLFSILDRLFLGCFLFAFTVYSCVHGVGSDLALASTRTKSEHLQVSYCFNTALASTRTKSEHLQCVSGSIPASPIFHLNRLWAHRPRPSSNCSRFLPTRSRHPQEPTFSFRRDLVQYIRRYSIFSLSNSNFHPPHISFKTRTPLALFRS